MLIPHFFSAAADIPDIDDPIKAGSKGLGTEFDLGLGYNVAQGAVIKAGFSYFMPTEAYSGKDYNESNTWGWVMLIFKPTFYKSN
ncbi:MAG: hypothetical protein K8S16_05305 [Bacteroidales bacterium]|nr:hypothetical protein [Bacteroidales bacterium]